MVSVLRYLGFLFLAGATAASAQTLTAGGVIEQIKSHVGVPWHTPTVDTFKAGDPSTPVTGIAVTMMATYDVLVRAAARGDNLIITHEPTFYSHLDKTDAFEKANDPVWQQKEKFIRDHHLVVWRFHDHWHMHRPDGILTGVVNDLKWQSYQSKTEPELFTVPPTTLSALASQMKQRLGINVVRVVGDPSMKVTTVALSPGAGGPELHLKTLYRGHPDVLAIGEVPEWETIEYIADASAEGRHQALILLGHIPSEQAGMEYCTTWLKTFISGVKIEFVPAKEFFWLAR